MATYNGERYIEEQIQSIIMQTYNNCNLLIRDDGSEDSTLIIIEKYVNAFPNKIKLYKSDKPAGGVKENFNFLLGLSTSNYVMFCDQDDIWLPSKVEVSLSALKKNEFDEAPLLLYSDLMIVDQDLQPLGVTMFQKVCVKCKKDNVIDLLIGNFITGNTILLNRQAIDLIKTIPKKAIMHDWWISLIVANYGKIIRLEDTLTLYRQHDKNILGAPSLNHSKNSLRFVHDFFRKNISIFGMIFELPFRVSLIKFIYRKIIVKMVCRCD